MKNLFLLFLLLPAFLFGQDKPEPQPEDFDTVMTLTDFWETVLSEDTAAVKLRNVYVKTRSKKEYRRVLDNLCLKQKVVNHVIEARDIYFGKYFDNFINGSFIGGFNLDSITFLKTIELDFIGCQYITVRHCVFNDHVDFRLGQNGWLGIIIDECSFENGLTAMHSGSGKDGYNSPLRISDSKITYGKYGFNWLSGFNQIQIENSKLHPQAPAGDSISVSISGEIESITIKQSIIDVPIYFSSGTRLNEEIVFDSVSLAKIAFNNLLFPENKFKSYVKWESIHKSLSHYTRLKLPLSDGTISKYRYRIGHKWSDFNSVSSVVNTMTFDQLKASAKQFLDIYEAQGDIESYNQCYADIKAFENKRWKYLYKQDPTFEKWFRWRLNELISAYSDYGTNPAKAVIKSFWVIFFFTLFYMFFPSEWDISSKAAIIANFKRVADKKDKTASPVLKALAFLIVSFLNAFTLSINSFVTLGFGHIPTKGVARYFTILQGFIGWFLLTIFSVSLISQVLN